MNILHITTHFHPFIGGLENLVLDIASHQAKRNNVQILTLQYDEKLPKQETKNGVMITRHPAFTLLQDQYSIPRCGFSKRILEVNPDILFTHTRFFLTSFLAGKFFKKHFPKRTWIHVEHGQNFVQSGNWFVKIMARLVDETLGRWIFGHADLVVVMSETGEMFVKKLGAKKVQIIKTGIEIPTTISPLPRKNKTLFFGRLIREKGILEILEAAEKCPEWHFELVGSGPLLNIKNLPNVTWTREIAHENMNTIIQSADLILLPSWSESLSIAVLESCANGRAVVASQVGENENVLSPEFLISPKDGKGLIEKLKFLSSKYDVLQREGKRNQDFVMKHFSREKMRESYDAIIKKPLRLKI